MKKIAGMKKNIFILLLLLISSSMIKTAIAGEASASPLADRYAGFRASRILSSYPNEEFPAPQYWSMVGDNMAGKFEPAYPAGIWIVSLYLSEPEGYTLLNFPSPGGTFPWIYFNSRDENEEYLDHFDATGTKIWLQVEPGGADIDTLIHIVLNRYKHHPCVQGFGIDVEWYQTFAYSGGRKLTDAETRRWEEKVKKINPEYTLFLKHYSQSWMPPAFRGEIIFIDDSQDFTWAASPMNAMVNEFKDWGNNFFPNPVWFQFGYPADREWWSKYSDPAFTIGVALLENIPNCNGLFWVDFTITELFPVTIETQPEQIPTEVILFRNYPNPFNSRTILEYELSASCEIQIEVYDLNGHLLIRFNRDRHPAGLHRYLFDAGHLASGVYLMRLVAGNKISARKITILK